MSPSVLSHEYSDACAALAIPALVGELSRDSLSEDVSTLAALGLGVAICTLRLYSCKRACNLLQAVRPA